MNKIKSILMAFASLLLVFSCTKDQPFGSLDFVENAPTPSNLSALVDVHPDETGTVTITPSGDGVTHFGILYGDGTTDTTFVPVGHTTDYLYSEGNYDLKVLGFNSINVSEQVVPIEISLKAPEDVNVVVENDEFVSFKVNVSATATYGQSFDVYFVEGEEPVTGNIGETVSYTYPAAGTYTIRTVVKSASETTVEEIIEHEATMVTLPVEAAPVPEVPEGDVISVFSNVYENIVTTEWNPDWAQSTILTEAQIAGDDVLIYDLLNYTGIVAQYDNPTDLSKMTHVRFDYWTPDATMIGFKIVNTSYDAGDPKKESQVELATVETGKWVTAEIPLEDFTTDMSGMTQMLFVASGHRVVIDNLFFYNAEGNSGVPTERSPAPIHRGADVVSIFSDEYNNITVNEWNPGWGQNTVLSTVKVLGDEVLLYENLDYTGIVTDYDNPTDLSEMTHVHFDFWTEDATKLGLKIVNTSKDPIEEGIVFVENFDNGNWVSVDIPVSEYGIDMSGVTQLLFDTAGNPATVYVDNLYFYKD